MALPVAESVEEEVTKEEDRKEPALVNSPCNKKSYVRRTVCVTVLCVI